MWGALWCLSVEVLQRLFQAPLQRVVEPDRNGHGRGLLQLILSLPVHGDCGNVLAVFIVGSSGAGAARNLAADPDLVGATVAGAGWYAVGLVPVQAVDPDAGAY